MDRLLIMIKVKFLILFTLLLIAISCSEPKYKQNIEKINNASSISELVEIARDLRSGSTIFYKVCNMINDSIRSKSYLFSLRTITNIDYEKEEVFWVFEECDNDIPHFTEKLTFEISVENEDTIRIGNELVKVHDIKKFAEEFVSRPDSICQCYEKDVIDFFGEVKILKGGTLLSIRVKNEKGITKNEWKLFFNCMNEIISFYENKRNEISKHKWNIEYNSLSFKKKIAVTEMTNFVMFIMFYIDY